MEKTKEMVVKEIFQKYLELEELLHEGMTPFEGELTPNQKEDIIDLRDWMEGEYKGWRSFFENFFPHLIEEGDEFHNLIHNDDRKVWIEKNL